MVSKKLMYIIILVCILILIDYIIARFNKRPVIIYKYKLPYNYNALTLPPFGIIVQYEDRLNHRLISHEMVHWYQYRKAGFFIYYIKYITQKIVYGYDAMPMEVDARISVGESDYCAYNYTRCVRDGVSLTVNEPGFRVK